MAKSESVLVRSVKVADYMSTRVVTFRPTMNVFDAMQILMSRGFSGAPVVDDDGRLVGMLSESDLMQVVIQDSYYGETAGIVADFMHAPVDTVAPNSDIYSLAERFLRDGRRRFPVVAEDGKLVGQISRRDVLRAAIGLVGRQTA